MEELLNFIRERLEAQGTTCVIENEILKATLADTHFWVIPLAGGVTFRALFEPLPSAAANELGFLNLINRANRLAIVTRFLRVGPPDLTQIVMAAEAWFPNIRDTEVFGIFFSRYIADIAALPLEDSVAVGQFFQS